MSHKSASGHSRKMKVMNKELYDDIKKSNKRYLKERSTYLDIISDNLSVTADIVKGLPSITMHGRTSMLIENQKRVLEYTDSCIKVQSSSFILVIEGSAMKINYCTNEEMKITGLINSVSFK